MGNRETVKSPVTMTESKATSASAQKLYSARRAYIINLNRSGERDRHDVLLRRTATGVLLNSKMPHLCAVRSRIIFGKGWRRAKDFIFRQAVVIESLHLGVLAALLIAYRGIFRPSKPVVFLGTAIYCLLGSLFCLIFSCRGKFPGYGWEELAEFVGVIPIALFSSDAYPAASDTDLGSVSIQAFSSAACAGDFDITRLHPVAALSFRPGVQAVCPVWIR